MNKTILFWYIRVVRLRYSVPFLGTGNHPGTQVLTRKQFLVSFYAVLFVWGFSSHSRIFQSYGDVNITGDGLQILTYARHLLPLSSEG